ncbi:UDP-N-acetylmuramoyl-tripeptide--D-alanyl-D-alanine ligase [Blastomonas sp.]|uniref:UDP-N-acetylmuramoyl-tripeptide--D-alanyl-D- alanine ligase n=1 Tax=Blastomonas sp. TaxID=1909299 RepID=UPI00406A6382
MSLWTASELAEATGGTASAEFEVTGVAFDSREIQPGDLFIAMRGEATDGHLFIDRAMAAGAAGVICEQPIDHPHVLVADSAAALTALGHAARARTSATVIGVTGSAGKTSTKEALFHALDRMVPGAVHRSVKSYNNHVGVPLSLARMPRDARFGVFEMGMNHAGELAELTRIVRPHIALITTIAPAHIGNFSNGEEGIADAKAEIFQGLEAGGTAIVPHNNRHYPRLYAAAQTCAHTIRRFGSQPDSETRLIDAIRAPEGGSLITAEIGEARLCFRVSAPGEHWVMNALAVMTAVDAAGGDLAVAGLALADLPGMSGRGERVQVATGDGGSALLIDEAYNANPASMAATLALLGQEQARRRIAVLGAMKELGETSDGYHAGLAAPVMAAKVDHVILVGDEMAPLADALANSLEWQGTIAHVPAADAALPALLAILGDGDALLVKGSNSVGLSALVRALATSPAASAVAREGV